MTPAVWLSLSAVFLSATFGVVTLLMSARRDYVSDLEKRVTGTEGDIDKIKAELEECKRERKALRGEKRELESENYDLRRRLNHTRD